MAGTACHGHCPYQRRVVWADVCVGVRGQWERVGTCEGFSDRVLGRMTVGGHGRGGTARLWRCVRSVSLAQAPRPGCALPGPRPQPPEAFFPRRRCACTRDAGRRDLGAGRCPPAGAPG